MTSDDNTNVGNLDGHNSYSIVALGGAAVAWGGTTFLLGPVGQNDAIAADGNTVPLPSGKYTSIQILATSVFGPQSGSFTVNYSDGSHVLVPQAFSDWAVNSSESGESVVEATAYRNANQNGGNGRNSFSVYLYGYSIALSSGKQAVSIVLPSNPNIKIFAINVV